MKIFDTQKPTEFSKEDLTQRILYLQIIVEAILNEIAETKNQTLIITECPTNDPNQNCIKFLWKDQL